MWFRNSEKTSWAKRCFSWVLNGESVGFQASQMAHRRQKRPGFSPWVRRSPAEGNGNSLQHSCLENPMDRGAWWAMVHGVTKSHSGLNTHVQSLLVLGWGVLEHQLTGCTYTSSHPLHHHHLNTCPHILSFLYRHGTFVALNLILALKWLFGLLSCSQ